MFIHFYYIFYIIFDGLLLFNVNAKLLVFAKIYWHTMISDVCTCFYELNALVSSDLMLNRTTYVDSLIYNNPPDKTLASTISSHSTSNIEVVIDLSWPGSSNKLLITIDVSLLVIQSDNSSISGCSVHVNLCLNRSGLLLAMLYLAEFLLVEHIIQRNNVYWQLLIKLAKTYKNTKKNKMIIIYNQ